MSDSFELDVDRFIQHAGGDVNRIIRTVLIELGTRFVERSPVGDAVYWQHPAPRGYVGGHFRANWQYGFGNMPTSQISGTQNTLLANLSGGIPSDTAGVHFIVNNVPYSIRLENGWSRQAPQGIVARAVQEFNNIVLGAVR